MYGKHYFDNSHFSYEAMVLTLHHKPYLIKEVFSHYPEWKEIKSLKELEEKIWKLENFWS